MSAAPGGAGQVLAGVQVRGDRDGLARCLAPVEAVCADLALGAEDALAVRLAVEEACSNVVEHGYAGREPGLLALSFSLPEPDVLLAQVRDEAPAFHPDQAPAPDLLAELDERAIGGLGWHLIREVMTAWDYTSGADGNCLSLARRLATPPVPTATGGG